MRALGAILMLTMATAAWADDGPPAPGRYLFRRGESVPAWIEVPASRNLRFDMDVCVIRRPNGSVDVHPDEAPWTGSSLIVEDRIAPGETVETRGAPAHLWATPCDDEGGAS